MIRLGELEYLNALPLNGWRPGPDDPLVRRTRAAPRRLYELLRRGALDVSPVSSLAYWDLQDRYRLVPGVAIGASGPIQSVLLYTQTPLEDLKQPQIAVTPASITAVALLKLLLRRKGCEGFTLVPQDESTLLTFPTRYSGILLIGDTALTVRTLHPPPAPWQPYDLGELWWKWTGKPMVFALWLYRADWSEANAEGLTWVCWRLQLAREEFRKDPGSVIRAARARSPLSEDDLRGYFRCLDYDFGPQQREGLELFARMTGRGSGMGQE